MPIRPRAPTVADAERQVRAAAEEDSLTVHRRADQNAKALGYDRDELLDAVATGRFEHLVVEPNENNEHGYVLIGELWWTPGHREQADVLYVKFVLGDCPMLLSWKLSS